MAQSRATQKIKSAKNRDQFLKDRKAQEKAVDAKKKPYKAPPEGGVRG